MSPDAVAVDTWYQLAVLRVYGPWLSPGLALPEQERSRMANRIHHARLVLSMRDVEFPQSPPPPVVAFNQRETPQ